MSIQGNRDFLEHQNMIKKVCVLTASDLDTVYPALCDWSNVAIEEIIKTKNVATRLVFGQATDGFTGCRFGHDFIKLNRDRECIFIVSKDPIHSSVAIYYGVLSERTFDCEVVIGKFGWEDFCMCCL